MSEKAVKTSGCGKCLLLLGMLVIGLGALGFVFRNEIVNEFNKLRSSSSDNDFDRYLELSTKLNSFGKDTTENVGSLVTTDHEETSTIVLDENTGSTMTSRSTEVTETDDDYKVNVTNYPDSSLDARTDDHNHTATEQMTTNSAATTTTESQTTSRRTVDNDPILFEGSGSGSSKPKNTLSDDEDYVEGST